MKHRLFNLPGYTLIELLLAVTLFSVVLASLFAVLLAVERADQFRAQYAIVSQAERSVYEPIIRDLKDADAIETIPIVQDNNPGKTCATVRGFYVIDGNKGRVEDLTTDNSDLGKDTTTSLLPPSNKRLAVISQEKIFDSNSSVGQTFRWVKHEYYAINNNGNITIAEESSYANQDKYQWPSTLVESNCQGNVDAHWQPDPGSIRYLTLPNVQVTEFALRFASAQVPPAPDATAPFATVEIKVKNPKRNLKIDAPPLVLRTTVTPTFSYGVLHEISNN